MALGEGETVEWSGWSVRLVKLIPRSLPDRRVVEAHLEVSRGGGRPILLTPAQHLHELQQEWTTEVAIHSNWSGDFYTILRGNEGERRVGLTLVKNPMMRWLWLGGVIMGLGVIVRLWPSRLFRRPAHTVAASLGNMDGQPLRHRTTSGRKVVLHDSRNSDGRGVLPPPHGDTAGQIHREPQREVSR